MRFRARRLISGAGAACLAVSAFCFASEGALRAAPLLAIRLRLPLGVPRAAVAVAPSPSAVPAAAAAHRRRLLGEGPIVFAGDGTYQLGLNRASRNGLTQTNDNYSSALTMTAQRRTETSAIAVSSAFGYSGGGFAAGSLVAGYRTPKYAFSYGQVAGPSDTQLGIGGFARGVGLAIPVRNGDLSYLAATATQQDHVTYRVYGARRSVNAFGGFVSAAGYYGLGEQGHGREAIGDLTFRRYGEKLSTQTELAFGTTRGVGLVADGARVAAALQADLQGKAAFATLGVRYDPAGFETLTGSVDAGLSADLALRRHSNRLGDVNLSLGHVDDRVDTQVQHENHLTLSGSKSWNATGLQYVFGLDANRLGDSASLQRVGAITLSETIRSTSLFETFQQSSVSGTSGTAQQGQLALGISRALLGGAGAYQFARSTSLSGGSGGAQTSQTLSYHRTLGRKLDVQLAEGVQSSSNNGVATKLFETGVSLVRRISPVVALQLGANVFHQTGVGGGAGTTFTASLVGPFGFGAPRDGYGRINPNLPAVIRGLVTYSGSPSAFAYNASSAHGYNNALVVLDGHVTQRTDATGQFEFRFVPAGVHTIRLDTASVAAGLIADRDSQTVRVAGGQTATVSFGVGNFAGVAGLVYQQAAGGAKHGLGEVGIAIDGVQAGTSSPDGHYAIGRLSPGAHTVEIVDATLPSTVAILERKRTVTVRPGTSTPIDFVAAPLGSIAGNIVAPADGGFGALVGLKNVYVVAQPGEHAVITDDDGSFLLDNLPAGTYTLSVDPDTIPDGLGVISGPDGPLDLGGGGSLSGIIFKLGGAPKAVVYTFNDGKRQPILLATDPAVVTPGALLRVTARSAAKDVRALAVESDVFGGFPLRQDARTGVWSGAVVVPPLAKGDYALSVTAHRKDVTDAEALVSVDPGLPLFALRLSPRTPEPGHTVRVTLKTLAAVEEGDSILFEDDYKVVLPKPAGHVFGFSMRVWRKGLPYSGTLVTRRGQTYPLSLR